MEQSGSNGHTPARSGGGEHLYVVAQATGVLMARLGVDADTAFEKLFAMAGENARPVTEVAREMVGQFGQQSLPHTD